MTLSGGKMPDTRRPRTRDAAPTTVDGLTLVHTILQAGRELRQRLATVGHPRHLKDSELLLLWACSRPATDGPDGAAASEEGFSETGLAGPLGLSGSELSGMLYDLRDRGLLAFVRVPDGDSRQRIELSAEGQVVLGEAVEAFNAVVEDWMREMPRTVLRSAAASRSLAKTTRMSASRMAARRPRGKRGAA